MSFEAVLWATSDAPIADVSEFAILVMLAEKADSDGCSAFPSKRTIADRTTVDPGTVKRKLAALVQRGLLAKGDQKAAHYLRADRRPEVYDLLIPYEWFPNIERINKERAERGKPPLTPESRPPIAAAPAKTVRSDAGKPRSTKAARSSDSRGVSQHPREESSPNTDEVGTKRARGVSQFATGGLRDPRTSPMNQSLKKTAPSARSAPDAGGSTSGSRDCAASGSAAPGQTQQRLTLEQKQAVQRVRDLLPREFDRALPVRTPRAVADAVLDALAAGTPSSRTPEQLVQYRVMARWDGYWAPRFLAGEVDSPIGVLRALLAPASRDHDRCDERVNVDTGEACVPCEMRARDRAEQRREEAAQVAQAAPSRGTPAPSTPPVPVPPRQRSVPRPEPYEAVQRQPQPVVVPTEPMGDYASGASAARAEMRSKKADAHRRANLLYKAT